MHPQPITSINQRRSSDKLFDEVVKEMRFVQIESLDAPLADYAAIVRLQRSNTARMGDTSSRTSMTFMSRLCFGNVPTFLWGAFGLSGTTPPFSGAFATPESASPGTGAPRRPSILPCIHSKDWSLRTFFRLFTKSSSQKDVTILYEASHNISCQAR